MSANVALWTGPQHSGKTTAAERLVREARARGHSVAGILAPSIWQGGELVGFDVVDLATGRRCPLAMRGRSGDESTGKFGFVTEGLDLGHAALASHAATTADLTVVDEFGPLELKGGGWRDDVDRLVDRSTGLILLAVRRDLTDVVAGMYDVPQQRVLETTDSDAAIQTVLSLLNEIARF